ncbi:MAG: TVP38/TMEM64 family protein [Pseudomonadota bacterium]
MADTLSSSESDAPEAAQTAAKKKSPLARFGPLAVIAAAFAIVYANGWHEYLSLETLETYRADLAAWTADNYWAAIGVFMGIYILSTALSLPGASLLTIFGGFLFGLWAGTGAVVVSATVGATILFLAAKTALGDLLRTKADGFIGRMEKGFREDELSYMFILRLVPLFPFWGVNLSAGVLGVRLRNYLIATFFGIIPGSFVFVSIGAGAGAVLDRGESIELSGLLTQPFVLIPIVGLTLLSLIPIAYKRFARKSPEKA